MKKNLVLTAFIIFVLSSFLLISYAQEVIYIDPVDLGVELIGNDAIEEDYNGENHMNFRANYSSWDTTREYLWLISQKPTDTLRTSYLYLGEYDMSRVISVEFTYVSDVGETSHYVSLAKDKEGTEKVATFHVTEPSDTQNGLTNPQEGNMLEILDNEYSGPLYLFLEYNSGTKRIFTGNYIITMAPDPNATPEPTEEPTEVPAETTPVVTKRPTATPSSTIDDNGSNNKLVLIIAINAVVIIAALAIVFVVWKKKKK